MTNIFTNAKTVIYNNKEVKSITNNNGGVIWKKKEPSTDYLAFTTTENPYAYSSYSNAPIFAEDNITIDWGDGTTETATILYEKSHSYSDGLTEHTITFIGTNTEIPSGTFGYYNPVREIYIPSTVTTLGGGAFSNCASLSSITFAENTQITEIPNGCFSSCVNLSNITIPNTITKLGSGCFSGCTGLTSVIIPSSVTSLGSICFKNCTGLTSVTIPNTVANIESGLFINCTALENYELYWEDLEIPTYHSAIFFTNTNTIFTIPEGQTNNYITKRYPSDKLVERQN